MKKIALFLIALFCALSYVTAQDMSKFYISSPRADGILYFVMPQKMPYKKGQSNPRKELSYDFTFVDEDSVTMLATIVSNDAFVPTSVKIEADSSLIERPVSLLFCNPEKSYWITRIKCDMSFQQWTEIVQSHLPPNIEYIGEKSNITYSYSNKEWRNLRDKYKKLLTTVRLNNKK